MGKVYQNISHSLLQYMGIRLTDRIVVLEIGKRPKSEIDLNDFSSCHWRRKFHPSKMQSFFGLTLYLKGTLSIQNDESLGSRCQRNDGTFNLISHSLITTGTVCHAMQFSLKGNYFLTITLYENKRKRKKVLFYSKRCQKSIQLHQLFLIQKLDH